MQRPFGYGEPNEEIIKAAGEGEFDLAIISTHHYNWLMRLAYVMRIKSCTMHRVRFSF